MGSQCKGKSGGCGNTRKPGFEYCVACLHVTGKGRGPLSDNVDILPARVSQTMNQHSCGSSLRILTSWRCYIKPLANFSPRRTTVPVPIRQKMSRSASKSGNSSINYSSIHTQPQPGNPYALEHIGTESSTGSNQFHDINQSFNNMALTTEDLNDPRYLNPVEGYNKEWYKGLRVDKYPESGTQHDPIMNQMNPNQLRIYQGMLRAEGMETSIARLGLARRYANCVYNSNMCASIPPHIDVPEY